MSSKELFFKYLTNGEIYTHTSYDNGKFNVKDNKKFLKEYSKLMEEKKDLYMIEKIKDIEELPIFIDLDFKYKKNERYHNLEIIKLIINLYNKCLKEIFIDVDLEVYILERESMYEKQGLYKDGLHIIYPKIVTNRETLYYLREEILKEIGIILSEMPLKNSYIDVVDRIIYSNGLGMYGSTKVGLSGYKCIKRYDKNLKEMEIPSRNEILTEISLRNKEGKSNKIKEEIKIEKKEKIIKRREEVELTEEKGNFYKEIIWSFDSSEYEIFRDTCWIMYNEGFEISEWKDWCKNNEKLNGKCSKYDENYCNYMWRNQKPSENKMYIGTLIYKLKKENRNKYNKIYAKNIEIINDYKKYNEYKEYKDKKGKVYEYKTNEDYLKIIKRIKKENIKNVEIIDYNEICLIIKYRINLPTKFKKHTLNEVKDIIINECYKKLGQVLTREEILSEDESNEKEIYYNIKCKKIRFKNIYQQSMYWLNTKDILKNNIDMSIYKVNNENKLIYNGEKLTIETLKKYSIYNFEETVYDVPYIKQISLNSLSKQSDYSNNKLKKEEKLNKNYEIKYPEDEIGEILKHISPLRSINYNY